MNWLIVLGKADAVKWVLSEGRMAFRDSVNVAAVKKGDPLAIYVTRSAYKNPAVDEAQIVAFGEFLTPVDRVSATVAGEEFSRSCSIQIVDRTALRRGLPFFPLVENMTFIRNKAKWGTYLRRSLIPLTDADFERLHREFAKHQALG